jgi:hypothetical protein
VTALTNTVLVYTTGDADRAVMVALNAGDAPAEAALPDGEWRHALGAGRIEGRTVRLPAAGWAIGSMEQPEERSR